MEGDVAIRVEGVSKKYCKSLKRSMAYGLFDISRNLCGLGSGSERLRKGEFWAVDDVSFELRRGQTLGIIGPNGSGKTTLLKMLNGIFWPDRGRIAIRGRVGGLIAIGAGFHPLLTGRENIYVNAAILGMTKAEVDRKFDEIVDFAEIGDFLDVPVKFYSSGMYVKLGFAVAAHCEPEVLLLDEVLAVGDIKFQSKCFDFLMNSVLKKGRSVIFVSHSRYAVQDLCQRALYLRNGKAIEIGNTLPVIQRYLKDIRDEVKARETRPGSYELESEGITKVVFLDDQGSPSSKFRSGEGLRIRFYYSFRKEVKNPSMGISFMHSDNRYVITSNTDYLFNLHSGYDGFEARSLEGSGYFEVAVDSLYIPIGCYRFSAYLFVENNMNLVQKHENAGEIEVTWQDGLPKRSLIQLPHRWSIVKEGMEEKVRSS